jgi:hypothetical protein
MSDQVQFLPRVDDGLALPDLQQWVQFYRGYSNIPPAAWAHWDRLYENYREQRRTHGGTPVVKV